MTRSVNKTIPLLLSFLLFSGCFWDQHPCGTRSLGKDFWLCWGTDSLFQSILLCDEADDSTGGLVIVHYSVYEALSNAEYIIAKQHPDLGYEIGMRLYGDTNARGDYQITRLSDTLYLRPQDSLYRQDGHWYWRPATPWSAEEGPGIDTALTWYYIIDIRGYDRSRSTQWYGRESVHVYRFENETDYQQGHRELNLPDSLDFISTQSAHP